MSQVAIVIFTILTRRSGNRFKDLSTSDYGDSELREVFDGIQELYLNDTLMTWEDVCFPDLQSLVF